MAGCNYNGLECLYRRNRKIEGIKMKNFEFYEKEIKEMCNKGQCVALKDGRLHVCADTKCPECDFCCDRCNVEFVKWLYEEHVEVSKISRRTKLFLDAFEDGYIARDSNGNLYHYEYKPVKRSAGWSAYTYTCIKKLKFLTLDFIKWEDEEPWSVEKLRKLEVCDD
jgi:hypothetical protein